MNKTPELELLSQGFEWLTLVGGVIGSLFVSVGVWEGFMIFFLSSVSGMFHAHINKLTKLLTLNVFFTCTNIIGIWNHVL